MSFVVDGEEWRFDGWNLDDIEDALFQLFKRVRVAESRGERVSIGDDLHTRPVLGTLGIWDLFSDSAPLQLSPELRQEISAMLGRLGRYLDDAQWPDGFDHTEIALSEEAPRNLPDAAWAHHWVRAGRAIACLSLRRRGATPTRSTRGEAIVHWVVSEAEHRAFFRGAVDVEADSEATLERMAPHAFPDLLFLPDIWRGLRDFEGGYSRVRQDLRKLLTVLDDDGAWVFTASPPAVTRSDPPGTADERPGDLLIQRRFRALRGMVITPEAAEVKDDRKCREARERVLGGRTLYLEWHAKLEPNVNRVHIHAPVGESNERLIVGIFDAHLPLPGD